ncbi:SDR family oxidoreductase [Bacteriovorax sp. PP10]|uniref:Enoyl-[acyl-carrier-protein] reductase [NADH] n=1 Tax=Bacteriovorax antarcticus TaxID=3088717 RepID=A0ABU5VYK2_9BACT|nr:SDR family oxidoreductase [Bacteriovorax sp. PP10]MEA9358081.1 SDR family oxidoreductase [Bacteriovorax sp. PP10]
MSFLNLENKTFLITGVANKKSVAYFSAKTLQDNGADLIFTVQNEDIKEKVAKLFPEKKIYILDVENTESVSALGNQLAAENVKLDGFLHSIAFANYSEGIKPFHETKLEDYLQASNISCFSLVALSNSLKQVMQPDASVVTISISSTKATNYGYMGPIKASLDAAVLFLAKSFASDTKVRFNAVCSGPLKTSASAGIPGYIDNYLYAEQLTMRHQALETQEVANSVVFLLSPASSGINASAMVVDAGMSSNYFDESVVGAFAKRE